MKNNPAKKELGTNQATPVTKVAGPSCRSQFRLELTRAENHSRRADRMDALPMPGFTPFTTHFTTKALAHWAKTRKQSGGHRY